MPKCEFTPCKRKEVDKIYKVIIDNKVMWVCHRCYQIILKVGGS